MINPTNAGYSFVWTNEDTLDGAPPETVNFRCLTPEGSILSGKKHEMVFEYVSDSLDLMESFWRFFVPEYNISIPFVMVGHTFEPALSFDRSHINFREMLLGKAIVCFQNHIFQNVAKVFKSSLRVAKSRKLAITFRCSTLSTTKLSYTAPVFERKKKSHIAVNTHCFSRILQRGNQFKQTT